MQSGPGRLTWLYIAALSAVALLSLAGQAIVQLSLDRQMSDSKVINIAGRQRMLSQRIAKAALALEDTANASQRSERYRELGETLDLWERCHRGLQQGDAELGLPGINSAEVQRMFAQLQPSFDGVLAPARRLYSTSGNSAEATKSSALAADVAEILQHEPSFLGGMDTIVSQYAEEASQRVAHVKAIEKAVLAVTLIVLLLEGLFVFRPAVRRIRAVLAALQAAGLKLAAAKEAAEDANQAKTRFLAVTSHELRTPLHAVLGIAEQLQKTQLDDGQRRGIAVLHGAAARLLVLVDDLLDLARIDSGKLELRLETVPLQSLLDQVISLVRPAAEGKGLAISLDQAVDLPESIRTDGLRLSQVLINLLGNAVKFTDHGSVRLSVDRQAMDNGRAKLRYTVADTGIGIPPEEQQRIFESFSQVDTSLSRARGGVGLGLAISHRLVELLGGTLELTSQVGHGSQFTFAIVCDVDTFISPSPHLPIPLSPQVPLVGQSILVVDDAPANCYLATTWLREAGFDAHAASSGAEALRLIGLKTYDAALLDVHMPGMDGLELARAMRTIESERGLPRMPIIALTADVQAETRARLLQHSIDMVLHKPASETSILEALGTLLHLRRPGVPGAPPAVSTSRDRSLARLRGNTALLADLTAIFRQESVLQQAAVQEALQRNDFHSLQHSVHRLRGQVMVFDETELSDLLAKIEEQALAKDLSQCQSYWNEAVRKLEAFQNEVGVRA